MNVLALEHNESITAAVAVPDFDETKYCMLATRRGRMKRLSLADLSSVRPSGIIAINLAEGDELGWARLTSGEDHLMLVTEYGKALRIRESDVRTMGRGAAGVTGIKVRGDDLVTSVEIVEPDGDLLVVTKGGHGKRTSLDEYHVRSRGSLGVSTINIKALPELGGKISAARVVQDDDELTFMSTNGVALRTKVAQISRTGRVTRGVRLMNLDEGDTVVTVARTSMGELKSIGATD